jgi:hypothetical protein
MASPEYHVTEITLSDFKSRLYEDLPFLAKIDWSNVLLAGGAVTAYITPSADKFQYKFGDLDFFIHGLQDATEATDRALR